MYCPSVGKLYFSFWFKSPHLLFLLLLSAMEGWTTDWKCSGALDPLWGMSTLSFLLFSLTHSLSHPSSPLDSPQMPCLLPRSLSFFCPFCFSPPLLRIPCSHAGVLLGRVRLGQAHQPTLSLNPSTKSSIFAITLQLSLLLSVPVSSQHIFFSKLSKSLSSCIFSSLLSKLLRWPYTVGRLRPAPHKYALSSLVDFWVLTRFLYCWVHQDPCLSPSPVLKLKEPIRHPLRPNPSHSPFLSQLVFMFFCG